MWECGLPFCVLQHTVCAAGCVCVGYLSEMPLVWFGGGGPNLTFIKRPDFQKVCDILMLVQVICDGVEYGVKSRFFTRLL